MERRNPRAGRKNAKKKKTRINVKRFAFFILMVALCVELVVASFTSPWFNVKKIVVEGNSTIPREDIVRRMALPEEAKLFLLKKIEISKRIETNPVVKEVKIYRKLPDIVIVRIVERTPFLILKTEKQSYHVDSSGIPFRAVDEKENSLPLLVLPGLKNVEKGKPVAGPEIKSAILCLYTVGTNRNTGAARITFDEYKEMNLEMRSGFIVKFGRLNDMARKMSIAASLLKENPNIQKEYIYADIACPDAPALGRKS